MKSFALASTTLIFLWKKQIINYLFINNIQQILFNKYFYIKKNIIYNVWEIAFYIK